MKTGQWKWIGIIVCILALWMAPACTKKVAPDQPASQQQAQTELERQKAEQERLKVIAEQRLQEEARIRQQEAERQAMLEAENRFGSDDVYFDFDSSALTPNAQATLREKADWLRRNANVAVTIEGHCDERGTSEYNLALGDRRANSAKAFLIDLGIAPQRMTTVSYGSERPKVQGSNEASWAQNRRANFVVK